jgi:hypothetical protein
VCVLCVCVCVYKKRSIDDLMSELKGGGGVAKVCVSVCC